MYDDADERDRSARFTRRALVLFGAQAGVAGVLGWRLHHLQLVEADAYQTLAEENRINQEAISPPRGAILDRVGLPLAVNRPNFSLRVVAERADDVEATLARLQRLIELTPREIERFQRALARTRRFVPIELVQNLTWDEFARVNANAPALPGVEPHVGQLREYPERDVLAHVIGYVAAVTDEELANDRSGDPALRLPNARIGKNGVEKAAERMLRGQAGERRVEVNAAGRRLRELERDEGAAGSDVSLTIDLGLQRYAMERLKGESAAAVVMDIWTGDLLALASAPAYDPNKFVLGIGQTDWDALRRDEYDPLRDKAVTGAYPPGSTFKMLTALAALDAGVLGPGEKIHCRGRIKFGDRHFHCWKREGHGRMNLKLALKHSCDVYFYEAAKRTGIERLAALCQRFGIGERPDIEMPNVKAGLMPTPDWSMAVRGHAWAGGETLNVGIGQGAVLTTPLQLAVMTARLANGRHQVTPRLIKGVSGEALPAPQFAPLDIRRSHLQMIHAAMDAVSNEAGGTAFRSQIADPENRIAGKTGTAQVRRIGMDERRAGVRKNEELPWRLRDHALFVAYAPADAPRYAISVVVEHGGSGSKSAAPIARDIMMRALYDGPPPLDAYPPWIRPEIEAARQAAEEARAGPEPLLRGVSDVATGPR